MLIPDGHDGLCVDRREVDGFIDGIVDLAYEDAGYRGECV